MWIMTKTGFISVVQKPDDKDTLTVRSRVKGQIESLFPNAKVSTGKGTDYLYRAKIDRTDVATVIYDQIMGLNYSNFKGAVKDNELHDAYIGCWSVMMRYQTKMAPKPRSRQKTLIDTPQDESDFYAELDRGFAQDRI